MSCTTASSSSVATTDPLEVMSKDRTPSMIAGLDIVRGRLRARHIVTGIVGATDCIAAAKSTMHNFVPGLVT